MKQLLVLLLFMSTPSFADCEENLLGDRRIELPGGLSVLERQLVLLVGLRETNLNESPENGTAGEVGTWQVLPSTAKPYLREGESLKNLKTNVRVASAYLKDMLRLADNDILLALAAYNSGPKAIKRLRNSRYIPGTTANYVLWIIMRAKENGCDEVLTNIAGVISRDTVRESDAGLSGGQNSLVEGRRERQADPGDPKVGEDQGH